MSYKLFAILFTLMIFTFVWGKILLFIAKKKFYSRFCFFILRYVNTEFKYVHSFFLNVIYVLLPSMMIVVLSVFFKFNLKSFFVFNREIASITFLAILASYSIIGFIMGICSLIKTNDYWTRTINEIPWIESISFVPHRLGWIIPVSGALFEELFFRGYVFLLIRHVFPSLGLWIPLLIAGVLFSIQQMLNTISIQQAIPMFVSSMGINFVSCIAIHLSNSFWPALISHELFVVFYINQLTPSKKKNYVSYMD